MAGRPARRLAAASACAWAGTAPIGGSHVRRRAPASLPECFAPERRPLVPFFLLWISVAREAHSTGGGKGREGLSFADPTQRMPIHPSKKAACLPADDISRNLCFPGFISIGLIKVPFAFATPTDEML